jgi:hypothetical protein
MDCPGQQRLKQSPYVIPTQQFRIASIPNREDQMYCQSGPSEQPQRGHATNHKQEDNAQLFRVDLQPACQY